MIKDNRSHYPTLDGVRGLAILLVILFHSSYIPRLHWIDKLWHGISYSGWFGVDLFFVLSGFLITEILIREKNSEGFFINFYARRFLRIFPLYYLFLVLSFFVLPQPVQSGFAYWIFLSNIIIGRLGFYQSPVLDVTWSLSVEEQFYLIWPFLILMFEAKKMVKLCQFIFVFALCFRIWNYFSSASVLMNYVLLPTRMDSLCAGAWLAFSKNTLTSSFCKKALSIAVLFGSTVFCVDVSHAAPLMQTLGFSFNALAALFLITLLLKEERFFLKPVFQNVGLRTLGKYSYGMYLFHVPVIRWVFYWSEPIWMAAVKKIGLGFPVQVLFHLVAVFSTLAVAFVSYQLYEKHFLKLKRSFVSMPSLMKE